MRSIPNRDSSVKGLDLANAIWIKEHTRPFIVRELVFISARIIDVSPSLIGGVRGCIVESNGEKDPGVLLCRECVRSPLPRGDLLACVELVDFGAPRVEMER